MERLSGLIPDQFTQEYAFRTRQEQAAKFCEELTSQDAASARIIADDLHKGTKELANTVVIIPVAAGQDADLIAHTVSEYSRQDSPDPFTLILGLNAPTSDKDSLQVQKTKNEAEQAKKSYPSVDIRSTFLTYDEPIIGQIRRDLWNAITLASVENASFIKKEVIGINHDIDLVRLSPDYIRRVQDHYSRRDSRHIVNAVSPAIGSMTNHAYSQKHPNTSKAVYWNDFYFREMNIAYEAGIIIPLSLYAKYGGFSGSARTHEVASFTNRVNQTPKLLAGTFMDTSPRRYLARINEHGYDIWSVDSFSANDECRDSVDFLDISINRKIEIVRENLSSYATNLAIAAINRGCDDVDVNLEIDAKRSRVTVMDFINRSVKLTENRSAGVLNRVVGSQELAEKFREAIRHSVTMTLHPEIFDKSAIA
jgi:hypothetical protein